MKKFLLISLLFLFQLELMAQEYFPFDTIGTSWNEFKELGSDSKEIIKWIESYFISGDTVIESFKYFKIYDKKDTCDNYIGCFREKDKIVSYIGVDYFGFDSDTAIIIYDFSKKINDEVSTGIIIAIDSILISGKYRKRYILNNGENWIEGIGSTYGFFYPITAIPTKVYWRSELTCFKKEENIIYLSPNFTNCTTQIVQNINELKTELFFQIFPNPAKRKEDITILSDKITIDRIQVYNSIGQLINTFNYKKSQIVKINLSDYSSTIYILKIFDSSGNVYTNKLIID